jgi:hypothetical protein
MQKYALAQELRLNGHVPKIGGAGMMANSHVPNAFDGDKKVAVILPGD